MIADARNLIARRVALELRDGDSREPSLLGKVKLPPSQKFAGAFYQFWS